MLQELGPHRVAQSNIAVLTAPDERAVLEALAEVGVAFTNERQLDPVLDRLLGTALQVVRADAGSILAANAEDMAEAKRAGIGAALLDRLALDPGRLEGVAKGLEDIADLPDPIGRIPEEIVRS